MLDIRSILRCYVLPTVIDLQLAVVGTYCLLIYHADVAQRAIKLPCFAYALMIANSLAELTKFVPDDTFYDLRILLDYAQLILALPLITTEYLIKNEVFSEEISGIPVFIGFTALVLFIVFEYKRQDLTDLTIILSVFLYGVTGAAKHVLAFLGALIFSVGYFAFKRNEGVCLRNQGKFNLVVSIFAFLSLAAFEPQNLFALPVEIN